jgi:hypothetical protein
MPTIKYKIADEMNDTLSRARTLLAESKEFNKPKKKIASLTEATALLIDALENLTLNPVYDFSGDRSPEAPANGNPPNG